MYSKAIKLSNNNSEELTIGYNYGHNQLFLSIQNSESEDIFSKIQLPREKLIPVLEKFKNVIENTLNDINKEKQ